MAILFVIRSDAVSAVVTTFARRDHYRLDDGTLVPVCVTPAWCVSCARFVPAERVETENALRERLARLEHFARNPGWIPPDEWVRPGELVDLRLRLRWRASRTAPPRCLLCGDTAIVELLESGPTDIAGVGTCTVEVQFADVTPQAGEASRRIYGIDGDRIAEEFA